MNKQTMKRKLVGDDKGQSAICSHQDNDGDTDNCKMSNNACKNDFLLGRSLGRSQSSCSDDEESDSYYPSDISESDPISPAPLDDHIKTLLHNLPETHWASPAHTDNDAKEPSALKPEIDGRNTTLHELPLPQGEMIAQIANAQNETQENNFLHKFLQSNPGSLITPLHRQGELVEPPPTTTVTPLDHNNDSQISSQASNNANYQISTVTYNLSAIKGCRRQEEVECRMEAVGNIINTYKPLVVCTQELSRQLQRALYPHISVDYNRFEGTFASSLPLNRHNRGCANGMMLRSDAKFVKGGTVHFGDNTTTMGYDFIFAIVKIADGEEALILNTHLESHSKVTDEDGNRLNNLHSTGVFPRVDQIGQISSFVKGYTEIRQGIKFVILHGDMNWDDNNANKLYIEGRLGCDEDLVESLGDNWVDAWLENQDSTDHKPDPGYTYDSLIPFNGGSYSVRKRLDRILFWQRPEGGSHLRTTNCVVVEESKENVKERTEWVGERYLNNVVMPPSDHFAVLATFDYFVAS